MWMTSGAAKPPGRRLRDLTISRSSSVGPSFQWNVLNYGRIVNNVRLQDARLQELTAALEYYQSKKDRMITFEYILIAGVNDSIEQAKPLAALARRLFAKVNLIPYNQVEGLPWKRPAEETQEKFLAALEKQKVIATLRREKGHDIDAACGQLRLKTEKESSNAVS